MTECDVQRSATPGLTATGATRGAGGGLRIKLAIVVIVALVMSTLILLHVQGVNGPWYWKWSWRRLGFWPLYPLMALASTPFWVAQWMYARRPDRARRAVAMLMLATLALELAAIACQPPGGLTRLRLIIESAVNTSYYTAATFLKDLAPADWLAVFPQVLPDLMIHAKYKPPGLILFYYVLIRLFGVGPTAALIGGLIIAAAATLTVVATYRLVRYFGGRDDAAFCAASFMAMTPSLVLFLAQFDQVYPALAALLMLTWAVALERRRVTLAIAFGALLASALFLSYIFLVCGVFLAAFTLLFMYDHGRRGVWRAVTYSAIAVVTIVLLYLMLAAATYYDPIETTRVITELQMADLIPLERPFPRHILFDLIDFALGSGWISVVLAAFYLAHARGHVVRLFGQARAQRLVFLALLQIAVVACAALLPGETARLWMLMLPLLMAPVGLELARWPMRYRVVVYACLWLVLVATCQNMTFIYMGPELDGPRH
jgi:hypothetical protein